MNTSPIPRIRYWMLLALLALAALLMTATVRGDDLVVSCPGGDPGGPFSSLNEAVLSLAGIPGPHHISVTGTCTESVWIEGFEGLTIEAPEGREAVIERADLWYLLKVKHSEDITLRRLVVRNAQYYGVEIDESQRINVEHCTVEDSGLIGLYVRRRSRAEIVSCTIRGSGAHGVAINHSDGTVIGSETEPTRIYENDGPGLWANHSRLLSENTVVENNGGWGLHIQVSQGNFNGVARGNQEGGVRIREQSRMALYGGCSIQDNNGFGVRAMQVSQVAIIGWGGGGVTIEGNSEGGLEVLSNSQAWISGSNRFRNNGTPGLPNSAGIRVNGSSQITLEQGNEITDNHGPGILMDILSTVEATDCLISRNSEEGVRVRHMSIAELGSGTEFEDNGEGPVACDSTALVITDLLKSSRACRKIEGTDN